MSPALNYLTKLRQDTDNAPERFVRRAIPQAVGFFKASVQPFQRNSVDMSNSISSRFPSAAVGEVITSGKGAQKIQWLRRGTRSHIIQALRAKALRFVKGTTLFRKRVLHPGTVAKPILDRGYSLTQAMLEREAATILGENG